MIREIIEELPEDQRAAIGMFYYGEMSIKEIAAAMGVSESTVKSRLMYGRNKIEKRLKNLQPISFPGRSIGIRMRQESKKTAGETNNARF